MLETETFAAMAASVRDLGRELGAPVGVVLEGGYDANVLAECVCAVLPVLAGEAGGPSAAAVSSDPLVARAREQFARWLPLGQARA